MLYTVLMKQFLVSPVISFPLTTGVYRMTDHPERGITLVRGDAVPTLQRKKVKFRLIRAANNSGRG